MTRPALTNVEFVRQLMEHSAYGGLIQAFVLQALKQYASKVARAEPAELDTPLVSGHAWYGCALEVRSKLALRFDEAQDAARVGGRPAEWDS